MAKRKFNVDPDGVARSWRGRPTKILPTLFRCLAQHWPTGLVQVNVTSTHVKTVGVLILGFEQASSVLWFGTFDVTCYQTENTRVRYMSKKVPDNFAGVGDERVILLLSGLKEVTAVSTGSGLDVFDDLPKRITGPEFYPRAIPSSPIEGSYKNQSPSLG